MLVLLLTLQPSCLADEILEHKLKALYMLRLADFITWPDNLEITSFTLCIDPKDPVAKQLQKIDKPRVKSLAVLVIDLPTVENIAQCQMLYLSKSSLKLMLTDYSVVTLSSEVGFAEQGGMIEFYQAQNKIKMKANLVAVKRKGIKFSSKLIPLLQIVKQKGNLL